MFGKLFKSKREVDEMPVAVKTSSALPNLATMLILSMTTYIEQNQAIAGELVPVIKNARQAYNRLLALGMGSTQNAKVLKAQIDSNDAIKSDNDKAKNLIDFVKVAQAHFGPRTVLVSYSAFEDICKRYNLTTGLLQDYCGVIPETNIQDIERVSSRISTFCYRGYLNTKDRFGGTQFYVERAILDDNHADLKSIIRKNGNIITLIESPDKYRYREKIFPCDIKGYNYGKWGHISKIYGEIISPKTFFIACPKQFLKNPDIKIQKKPVDPAVYQLTPYGVLVHTIWGEEAEDEAFRKFMELNNIIAHS